MEWLGGKKNEVAFWPLENDEVCLKDKNSGKSISSTKPGVTTIYYVHSTVPELGDTQIWATSHICFNTHFSP